MNDKLLNQFRELLEKIEYLSKEKKELSDSNEMVRKYISICNDLSKLEKTKSKLEPEYYAEKMRACNHVFCESYKRDFQYEGNKKYDIVISYYCLKCGCLSIGDYNPNFYYKNSLLPDLSYPSFRVSGNIQRDIINNSNNFQIIQCGNESIYKLMEIWKDIEENNNLLSFEEKLEILKDRTKNNTKIECTTPVETSCWVNLKRYNRSRK